MISRAYRSASSLHRFLRGWLGGKARPFMTSSPARLLGLFQVSERLLQPIRRAIGHIRPVLTGYYTLSFVFLPPETPQRFRLSVLQPWRRAIATGLGRRIGTLPADRTRQVVRAIEVSRGRNLSGVRQFD